MFTLILRSYKQYIDC